MTWKKALESRSTRWLCLVRDLPANAGDVRDTGSNPGLRRLLGGGNGNPLQYPCWENPKDGGVWQATVHGVDHLTTARALTGGAEE